MRSPHAGLAAPAANGNAVLQTVAATLPEFWQLPRSCHSKFLVGPVFSVKFDWSLHCTSEAPSSEKRSEAIGSGDQQMAFTIRVNGTAHTAEVDAATPLLWVLRDVLGMCGTKFGCGVALCGACTVHIDGVPARSCVTPIRSIGDKAITTIEAIGQTPLGKKLQQVWLDLDVVQCGYCQSGQIMSAVALLANTPNPSDADIDAAM